MCTTKIRLPQASQQTDLKPVPIFDVTILSDERTQTLRRLLEKGHVTVAPLREPKLILHSHLPHLLGSAYCLGASSSQLTETYEHEITTLKNIDETFVRGTIEKDTWRSFLCQKEYTVAYVDFFDKEVENGDGDWKGTIEQYLYSGPEPLINGYIGGLGHPFIHLAYAYEFQSKEVATQALSLGCTEYDPLHTLLDSPPPDTSTYKTTSLAEVLECVRNDKRFDGLLTEPGILNLEIVLKKRMNVVLEHWTAWEVVDPVQQLEQCCDLGVLLAISSVGPDPPFDFFCAHIMTVAHALRVLWQHLRAERQVSILKQYAIYTILIYINQFRPKFGMEHIESVNLNGRDWDWVIEKSLGHTWAMDDHFFKAVRAPKVFEETYGRKDGFYLKAAVKYISEFNGWQGFGLGVDGYIPSRDGYIPEQEGNAKGL